MNNESPAVASERPRRPRRAATPARHESRRWPWYGVGVLAVALMVNALAGERGYLEWRRLEQRHAGAVAQLAARRAENETLRRRIREMKSDPAAIEREIRGQLGYARPGELVFTVRDAPAPRPPDKR